MKRRPAQIKRPPHPVRSKHSPDWTTLLIIGFISIFGAVMVFNASNVDAYYDFGDKYHFLKLHLVWLVAATTAALCTTVIPLSWLKKIAKPLFISGILGLIIVLIPGVSKEIYGAKRWIYLGNQSIQPSELIKIAILLYVPIMVMHKPRLVHFTTLLGGIIGLLMLEPDLGTSMIVCAIAIAVYYASGARVIALSALAITGGLLGVLLIITSPYRLARLQTFFNPMYDPLGVSYHITQVLISLGSGGLFGTGIGQSRQKYQYLPEATTDSIFAVIAEEGGFITAGFIVLTYALVAFRMFTHAQAIPSEYPRLIATAAATWITIQAAINLAAMVALIPLTGVPLPFISYGGSSLITTAAAVGLYANASRFKSTDSP